MVKNIVLDGQKIDYLLKTNKRTKGIRLSIYPNGLLVVSKPRYASNFLVTNFIKSKSDWILKRVSKDSYSNYLEKEANDKERYIKYKERAREYVTDKIEEFNKIYHFKYNKISIKNQKTRWGSCSTKGNLNFNYKILFLDPREANYIIVHELCHLVEMNHGSEFWSLVSIMIPDYIEIRKKLKKYL